MPIVEEMNPADDEEADANEPAVVNLIDTFRRWERLLPTIRHYGWKHPETDGKLRATYQGLIEALRADPAAVFWKLSPYSFTHRGQTIWEPPALLDAVPYHLFAAGFARSRSCPASRRKSSAPSARSCSSTRRPTSRPRTTSPPRSGRSASSTSATTSSTSSPRATPPIARPSGPRPTTSREEARRATEEKANRAEAAAMVIETDQAALKAARIAASALALDPVAKKALGVQLSMTPERWSERYVDVLTEAILNARRFEDTELIYEPLDSSTRDLVLQRRFDIVFQMFDAVAKALEAYAPRNEVAAIKAEVSRGMFSPETFRLVMKEAVRTAPVGVQPPEGFVAVDLDALARDLMPVVSALGPAHLDVAFDLVGNMPHEGLRKVLLGYLERILPGREAEIVDRVMTLDIEIARPILRILAAVKKPGATEALRRLAGCSNAMLRCEAIALLSTSPEQLKDDLAQLAETGTPDLRIAALRTPRAPPGQAGGPALVRRVQDATFHQLGVDERKEILGALHALHLLRAEQILAEILEKRGLFSTDEAVEQTRVVAVELLGRESRSMEALQSVLKEARRRWGNSPQLREKATTAAEAIAAKLGRRITESGRSCERPTSWSRSQRRRRGPWGERRDAGRAPAGGLDVLTQNAGEMARRVHARDLAASIVTALFRLVKLSTLHSLDNQAMKRQIEETVALVNDYGQRTEHNVSILFAHGSVFVGGLLLRANRGIYEARSSSAPSSTASAPPRSASCATRATPTSTPSPRPSPTPSAAPSPRASSGPRPRSASAASTPWPSTARSSSKSASIPTSRSRAPTPRRW